MRTGFAVEILRQVGASRPSCWLGPGDQTRLGQVFLNLLVNAAQACASLESPDHEIALHVERHGERVRVTVSDTGPGIAPDLLPHVFEPFVTTRHGAQGTGLGLSIVREIVLACGGSVDASSEPGRGARFVVELASAERPEPGERPQPAMARARARVLLVDDEPQLRAVVERVLADAHDVSSAGSGAAALALLEREERFDVLVCDLTMPGMSGAELLEIVTQRWPELGRHTVITTGGLVSERVAAIAQSAGIPVLAKPFSAETLLRVVAELVTRGGSTR